MRFQNLNLVLIAVTALHAPTGWSSEKTPEAPTFPEAKVVWAADKPICPLTNGRPQDEINDVGLSLFSVEGDVTEPVLKSRMNERKI